jgi:hypothetical protein
MKEKGGVKSPFFNLNLYKMCLLVTLTKNKLNERTKSLKLVK